jgi:hypothetical protein
MIILKTVMFVCHIIPKIKKFAKISPCRKSPTRATTICNRVSKKISEKMQISQTAMDKKKNHPRNHVGGGALALRENKK